MIPLRILRSFEKRKNVFGYVLNNERLRPVFGSPLTNSQIVVGANNCSNRSKDINLINCRKYTINHRDESKFSCPYLTTTTTTTNSCGFNNRLLSTLNHLNRSKSTVTAAAAPTPTPFSLSSYRCTFNSKLPDPSQKATRDEDLFGEASKLGLFAKFKMMYKKYWYVLIPVHVVTSLGWLGGFYYLSKSGVDVPALLQHLHISESVIHKVQGTNMGHVAIAYLCYKVATPLRYAVTLGGTTVSIKYLVQWGYIKPMPSKRELMRMYEQKKADRAAARAIRERHEKTK